MSFRAPVTVTQPESFFTPQRILLFTSAMILALVIMFIIIYSSMKKRSRERLEAELAAAGMEAGDLSLVDLMNEGVEYEPIQLIETNEQKLKAQIRDLANSDPEIVAQLIKTWLVNS